MVASHHNKAVGKGLPEFMHAFPIPQSHSYRGTRNLYWGALWRGVVVAIGVYGLHLAADYQRNKLYKFANMSRTFADWRPTEPPRSNGALKQQSEDLKS